MVYEIVGLCEKTNVECINKLSGCRAILGKKEISCHLESCPYGPTHVRLCQQLGYPCSYLTKISSVHLAFRHFTQNHSFPLCQSDVIDIRLEGFCTLNRTERSRWTPLILDLVEKYGVQLLILSLFNCHDQTVAIECIQLTTQTQSRSIQVEFKVKAVDTLKNLDLKWAITPTNIRLATVATKPFVQFKIDQLYPYAENNALTVQCLIVEKNAAMSTKIVAEAVSVLNVQSSRLTESIYAYPEHNLSIQGKIPDTKSCAPPLPPRNLSHPQNSRKIKFRKNYGSSELGLISYIICHSCKGTHLLEYFKCLQCLNFHLCKFCMENKTYRHHIFVHIWNVKQEVFLMTTWRSPQHWRPFFLEQNLALVGIVTTTTVEVLCTSCANYKNGLVKYICLNCTAACRLCSFCFEEVSKTHHEDHLFVVVDTMAKLKLVINNVYYY